MNRNDKINKQIFWGKENKNDLNLKKKGKKIIQIYFKKKKNQELKVNKKIEI